MARQKVPEDFEGAVPHEEIVGHSKDKRNERKFSRSQQPPFHSTSSPLRH
jgi:hypothetical protein